MDEFKTAEDFINDESFISWVFDPDEMNQKRWDLWLKENPDKKPLIEETVSVLRLVRLKENPVNRKQIEEAEQRLRASIGAYSGENKIRTIAKRRIWYAAAAVLIISVAVGMTYLFQSSAKRQLATNYGQIVKDKLPDGTEVILNAHSKLTLGKKWKEGNAREVWIKGEAFFHVKKTPEHDKFIVHTDAFDIEVTGTSFNVKN
ncbi:MAG: FecR family protein, partial [Ginsengibacter sp.]